MTNIVSMFKTLRHRERMRSDFWYFADHAVLSKLPKRVEAPHQKLIAAEVQRLADDPNGGILIVCVPPGGAKSLMCARALPAWIMGREANARVLAITNTMPLVESHGRAVREIIQTKEYQRAFNTQLSQQQAAASAFATENKSEFFGVGSAGAALGRRAEWVVIDDPISGIEEAHSVTQMQKLHEAWSNNIKTRIVPGTKVVIICQRLSAIDLVAHVLASQVPGGIPVRYVRIPMICDDPASDPLGRAEGEPLWPQYWTQAMLVDAQSDPIKWRTLYQQKPASDSAEWFRGEDILPTPAPTFAEVQADRDRWRIYMGVDMAYTDSAGDATVFAVVAFEKRTGAMHVLDIYREQVGNAQSVEDLLDWIARWKPDWIGMDADAISNAYLGHLKVRALARGVSLRALEQMPLKSAAGRSKDARAIPLRLKAKAGLLHVDRSQPWAPVVMRELLMFPHAMGSAVDDVVDALALIARKTSNMVVYRGAEETAKPVEGMTLEGLYDERDRMSGHSFGRGVFGR